MILDLLEELGALGALALFISLIGVCAILAQT